MEKEIPCATCKSWNGKDQKFSCNPKACNSLSTWLHTYVPQLTPEVIQMQVQLPAVVIQYIV